MDLRVPSFLPAFKTSSPTKKEKKTMDEIYAYDFKRHTILQGDVALIPVEQVMGDLVTLEPSGRDLIVAHSETGHHHVVEAEKADGFVDIEDPSRLWMTVREDTQIVHQREEFQHEAQIVPAGHYLVQRQTAPGPRPTVWSD